MKLSEQYEMINRYRQTTPVDVEGLVTALGVDLHYAYLGPEVSGMIERCGDGYRITINAVDPPTRKRFTIAHELGHYMLHRPLIGDGLDDDRAYRSTAVGQYHNTAVGPREETEANKFAANVLMPLHLINRLHANGVTDVKDLARELGVSEHAMSIRVGEPYPRAL